MSLQKLKIGEIRENPVALRDVNRESVEFQGLVQSMRVQGFIGAITVRRKVVAETNEKYFELVDGLHRLNAARDAGIEEIPCNVIDADDYDAMKTQILANIHKVDTQPMQYTAQLKRMLNLKPLLTVSELAASLGKSSQWLNERLSLTKITSKEISDRIDHNEVCLANAYALAKLPEEEQPMFLQRAMSEPPAQFTAAVAERVKEIREAHRRGLESQEITFSPVAHMQKLSVIKAEFDNPTVLPRLLKAKGITDVGQAANLAIAFCLNMDDESVANQKAKFEARMKEQAEAKARRETEKITKQAKKAADAAVKAQEELEKANKLAADKGIDPALLGAKKVE